MEWWRPSAGLTKQEQRMMKRLTRVRALFGFLRLHRHELFDSAFQDELSIEDSEMRHGRKSKSKRFDGYKEHIARDLDLPILLACAVTPANRPEEEGRPDPR